MKASLDFLLKQHTFQLLEMKESWCYLQKCWCLHTAHRKTSKIRDIRGPNIQMSIKNNPQEDIMHIYNTYVSTACTFTVVYLLHLLTFCKNVNIKHTGSREKNLIKYICRPQSILFCLDFVIFFLMYSLFGW